MKLGQKVRALREIKGYSQDFMSIQLEISQATYSRIENECTRIDVSVLIKIAEILKLDLIRIFAFDEKNVCNVANRYPDELKDKSLFGIYEIRILKLEKRMDELQRIIREAG